MKVLITTVPGCFYTVWYTQSYLSQSEAFRALVKSQDKHATKFVIRFVGRQIQLIEATKQYMSQSTFPIYVKWSR